MQPEGIPMEVLKRLPQKIQLSRDELPIYLKVLFFLVLFGILFGGLILLLSSGISFSASLLVLMFPISAVLTLGWFGKSFYRTFFTAYGLLPFAEYLPGEKKMVIHDLQGFDDLFKPEARLNFHLDSISKVLVESTTQGKWRVSIRTKKDEVVPIHSSERESEAETREIAHDLVVMIDLNDGQKPNKIK